MIVLPDNCTIASSLHEMSRTEMDCRERSGPCANTRILQLCQAAGSGGTAGSKDGGGSNARSYLTMTDTLPRQDRGCAHHLVLWTREAVLF